MKKIIPSGEPVIPAEARRVFEGVLFDVYHWEQEMFDGTTETFEGLKRADSALTIGIDEDDELVLINDAQPHKKTSVRLPGGRVDYSDQSTLEAAKREMREETGYEFKHWRLIHVGRATSKIDWFVYFYLAYDVAAKHDVSFESAGEKIAIHRVSFDEALQQVFHDDEYSLLSRIGSIETLKSMPEFRGQTVDIEPKREMIERPIEP